MKLAFVFGQAMNWLLVIAATAPAAATDANVASASAAIGSITDLIAGIVGALLMLTIVVKALDMLFKGSVDALRDVKMILGLVLAVLLLVLLRGEIVNIITATINNATSAAGATKN